MIIITITTATMYGVLLAAKQWAKCLAPPVSAQPHDYPRRSSCNHAHYTDGEMEAWGS